MKENLRQILSIQNGADICLKLREEKDIRPFIYTVRNDFSLQQPLRNGTPQGDP